MEKKDGYILLFAWCLLLWFYAKIELFPSLYTLFIYGEGISLIRKKKFFDKKMLVDIQDN